MALAAIVSQVPLPRFTSRAGGGSVFYVRPPRAMQTIAHDAQRMSLLFEYGVLTGNDVIAWSDSAIVQLNSLPDALLQLSMTAPDKTADIMSHLHQLSSGSDFWAAVRSAMPQIRDFVGAYPDRAESIANHLHFTASFASGRVPKDLHFMFLFDDAFSLAHDGIYGEPQTIYHDFIHELEKFKLAA